MAATKDAYYFKHDSNTRNDPKIIKLRRIMGREGSDVFFDILSILREQAEYRLPVACVPDLAYDLRYPETKLNKILNDFDLFIFSDSVFYSQRLLSDMEEWERQKQSYRDRGKKGGEAKAKHNFSTATPQLHHNLSPALPLNKVNKGDKINKVNKETDYVGKEPPPVIDGFRSLESQKEMALNDEAWIAQVANTKVQIELIPAWLDAFNRFLTFKGETLKQERDYRQHFPRWLTKVPNYLTMNPDDYQPVGAPKQNQLGRKVIMLHNSSGTEDIWSEQEYEQYRNNATASGYKFQRYE